MAELNSSDEGGYSQEWRTPSRSLHRQKKKLSLREGWDQSWSEKISDRTFGLVYEDSRYKHRQSAGSGQSSPGSHAYSTVSNTRSQPNLRINTMGSDPPLEFRQTLPSSFSHPDFTAGLGLLPDPFNDKNELSHLSPSSFQNARSPSPSIQLSPPQAEPRHSLAAFPIQSGPLDRYLAQDDDLNAHGDDPEQTNVEWIRLRSLRANALRLRSLLRIKRKHLRDKQSVKASSDAAFIGHVRELRFVQAPSGLLSPTLNDLDSLYDTMQEARDAYGPLEYDYDRTEEMLDDTEFEMAMIEGRIYRDTVNILPGSTVLVNQHSDTSPLAPSSFMGLSEEYQEEYDPLHAQYLSRLGDLDLAKERYHSSRQEHANLLATQESRAKVGLELHESLLITLTQLPKQETALEAEIAEIETDVERLRLECLVTGIELGEDEANSQSSDNMESERGEVEVLRDGDAILQERPVSRAASSQSSQSMFPLLLPKNEEDQKRLWNLIKEFDRFNKSDRINRWLLFELQTSPLQVELLFRVFLQWLKVFDFHRWQQDVLDYWGKDDTNQPADIFTAAQAHSSTIQSHPSILARSRLHSKSIAPTSKLLSAPRQLRSVDSAPGLLDLLGMSKGNELLEKVRA
ncbi:hypothetical protein DL95DRAFT_493963 [Leptodontidium sp. 2 PMI_412]|nr:hypothetical protein DL95DRAFT_493963 [Leptodontidium sp. 2 PMI_412]